MEWLGRGQVVETGVKGGGPRVRSIQGWVSTVLMALEMVHSCCISNVRKRKAFGRPAFVTGKNLSLPIREPWLRKMLDQKFLLPGWLGANSESYLWPSGPPSLNRDWHGSIPHCLPGWWTDSSPWGSAGRRLGPSRPVSWSFVQPRFTEHLPCIRLVLHAMDGVEGKMHTLPALVVPCPETGPKPQTIADC